MGRVLVKTKLQKAKCLSKPKFSQCLVDLFKTNCDAVLVEFKSSKDYVTLKEAKKDQENADNVVQLQHSVMCPIRLMQSLSSIDEDKYIPVAVCIVLESADQYILLTRRSSHLRSSPGIWVPPGGHLEPGEELLEGGLRELFEETGIKLCRSKIKPKILCLWETVFPIILGMGDPKSHVLAFYFHVKTNLTHKQLNAKISINPQEVEGYTWLPPHVVHELFISRDSESYSQTQFVWRDGKIVETELKYLKMYNRSTWTSGKLYSGTQCSIHHWYQQHVDSKRTSKI